MVALQIFAGAFVKFARHVQVALDLLPMFYEGRGFFCGLQIAFH